jgi:enoyl-CoA hydratase
MLERLVAGVSAEFLVTVTEEMCPAFGGVVVHRVYSTWSMAEHMEVAARMVLAPNLEPGEEGIGSHLSIDHLSPCPVGARVRVVATAAEVGPSTLVCEVVAYDGDRVLGRGRQVQRILPRDKLRSLIDRHVRPGPAPATGGSGAGEMADEPVILVERDGPVGILRLNRSKVLNALSIELIERLVEAMEVMDRDESIHVLLLAGGERAFAAGADIGDMATASTLLMHERNQFATWDRIRRIRKPIVAAVSGYALGGGCELMMMCDVVVASATAQFGQPEINLGVMPGAGGTQRLTRAIGKAAAMDVILTGRTLDAREALALGLVSRVVPPEHWYSEALKVARQMAAKGPVALRAAKECVNKAWELSLREGVEFERKMFYMLFSTEDQREGMAAFMQKRPAKFTGR